MPFPLGPTDGRYLVRRPGTGPESEPTHVLVLATLAAPQRHLLERPRRSRPAPQLPPPAPVRTTRVTIIDASRPLADGHPEEGRAWLRACGRPELDDELAVLARALRAHRALSANPDIRPVGIDQLLVARVGVGSGDEVAEGRWTEARELPLEAWRQAAAGRRRGRRRRALEPQAQLADALRERIPVLVCDELALRARQDLDQGQYREAVLQLSIALDAALAELPRVAAAVAVEAGTPMDLRPRIEELRGHREAIATIARRSLLESPGDEETAVVRTVLERLEAALRARLAGEQSRR